jgi:hypothetical protein
MYNLIKDEWFTRGWTLQEFLANDKLNFYDNKSNFVITKKDLKFYINNNKEYFLELNIPSYFFIKNNNVASGIILNWILIRKTAREEDKAYSIMGLLNTYIPPLYGEGIYNSFIRLLKEYMSNNCDTTLFNWISLKKNQNKSLLPNFTENCYFHQNILNKIIKNDIINFNWTNKGIIFEIILTENRIYRCEKFEEEHKIIIKNWIKENNIKNLYNENLIGIPIIINDTYHNGSKCLKSIKAVALIDNIPQSKFLRLGIFNIYNKILIAEKENDHSYYKVCKVIDLYDFNDFSPLNYDHNHLTNLYDAKKMYNIYIK